MNFKRGLLLVVIAGLIGAFFVFDLGQFLTLDSLKSNQQALADFIQQNWLQAFVGYFVLYVVVTALSLPGAAILTLGAGALFGLGWGLVLASFASTIGATCAFLVSRFLLRDWVKATFANRIKAIDEGIQKDGAFYLLTLRLVPLFPFFVINLVMGITSIRTLTYYWVSQVGMLIGTAVYVNAGLQLVEINTLADIVSADLILSFVLLGLFPLIAKFIINILQQRRVYAGWKKPKSFDRNMVVIGAGSAGLVTAYIAAAVKASVTLVEKNKMGGDCLNTGCVPSKALIKSAKLLSYARRARQFGFNKAEIEFDFAKVMERVQRVIKTVF